MRYVFYIAIILITAIFNSAYAQVEVTAEQAEALRALSPEQQSAVDTELRKTGGQLTPGMIHRLKEIPEFKDLKAEDIVTGKKLLESKENVEEIRNEDKPEEAKKIESEERLKSIFNRYRTVGPYQTISTDLMPFGYKFFSGLNGKFLLSRKDIPVSRDYIIGPGDEVKVMLWGRVNAQYDLVVDRDGNITIPQIGPLQVNGMRFDEMKEFLSRQADQIIGANMNVTMGSLKSIQVFLLGEVRKPGSYALDSFSTITTALIASGGPTDIGSLRKIELKRSGKETVVMDFYDFLLKGNKTRDRILQSGDVVFIPTAGPLVGVAGNVKRPAIYELKEKKDLMSLFEMAGGLIPTAYTQQIQVERIQKNERQIVIDIDDKHLTASQEFDLQDGDLVKVFSIVDKDVNVVFLAGNVQRPGKYEYKPGMKLRDLIAGTEDLLKETHFEYALIKRINPPGFETELIPFDLGGLVLHEDSASDIALKPQDSVYVFSTWFFRDKPTVTVDGEVRKKGTFELLENYRVKDAILEAGGLTRDAGLGKGEIFRTTENGDMAQIYFSVGLAVAGDSKENVLLHDKDRIVVHSIWEEKNRQFVNIEGDIKNPGQYPLAGNMRVSDLIFSAGNIRESSYLDEAEISSFVIDNGKGVRIDYRSIDLGAALKNDPVHNVLLQPYDRVFVKRIPEWREDIFVSLSGEVKFPGSYIVRKGEKLTSVLERAGGYSERAYLRGAVFTREKVRKLQQSSLDEMILRLEREILAEGSGQVSTSLSSTEIEAKKQELEQKQKFIESLKELKATGRMSIRLAHMRLLKGSIYDIELEDGDTIQIPVKSNVVNVVGAVMSRGSFIYSGELDHKDYIEMAGSYTRYADHDNVYVLKVDGTARTLSSGLFDWNSSRSRWELTAFGEEIKEIEPGDTIVVPEKLDRIAWLREIKDITQILYQIAVAAGVAIVVF